MAKERILNMVVTECPSKNTEAFNKWYNEVHIPMLMKYKGLKKVTRYKIMDEHDGKCQFIAVYEYDTKEALNGINSSPEFKAAIEEMQETQKSLPFELKYALACEPIKTWGK